MSTLRTSQPRKQMTNETLYLQQIMESHKRPASVLAITSGKGGVGKTNITANLGICLAASGKKVLLVDADFSLGNLDIVMNFKNRYNISHLIYDGKSIEEIIHTGPEGIDIICGASGLEELANINEFQRRRLLKELSKLQNDNDMIIIDTAAGISRSVVGFCLSANNVLVVTTPEATAMTDAYAMIKVLVGNRFRRQKDVSEDSKRCWPIFKYPCAQRRYIAQRRTIELFSSDAKTGCFSSSQIANYLIAGSLSGKIEQ